MGADGDAERAAFEPAIARGSNPDEYRVVWQGDGLATDEEYEIFGQRIGIAGDEIGGDFRISNVGADGDAGRNAVRLGDRPRLDEERVSDGVGGDGLATNEEFEIFGRRLGTPPVDSTAPETTITKKPKKRTKKRKAKFAFSSNEAGSTFECQLDEKAYKPCSSPYKHGVKRGKHTFQPGDRRRRQRRSDLRQAVLEGEEAEAGQARQFAAPWFAPAVGGRVRSVSPSYIGLDVGGTKIAAARLAGGELVGHARADRRERHRGAVRRTRAGD